MLFLLTLILMFSILAKKLAEKSVSDNDLCGTLHLNSVDSTSLVSVHIVCVCMCVDIKREWEGTWWPQQARGQQGGRQTSSQQSSGEWRSGGHLGRVAETAAGTEAVDSWTESDRQRITTSWECGASSAWWRHVSGVWMRCLLWLYTVSQKNCTPKARSA